MKRQGEEDGPHSVSPRKGCLCGWNMESMLIQRPRWSSRMPHSDLKNECAILEIHTDATWKLLLTSWFICNKWQQLWNHSVAPDLKHVCLHKSLPQHIIPQQPSFKSPPPPCHITSTGSNLHSWRSYQLCVFVFTVLKLSWQTQRKASPYPTTATATATESPQSLQSISHAK